MSNVHRILPSISELLEIPPLKSLVRRVNRNAVVTGAKQFLDKMRTQLQYAAANVHVPSAAELAERIADWIATEEHVALAPVINATGVVIHPELGRVPLPEEALRAIAEVGRGYASVEFDLATGGHRERRAIV